MTASDNVPAAPAETAPGAQYFPQAEFGDFSKQTGGQGVASLPEAAAVPTPTPTPTAPQGKVPKTVRYNNPLALWDTKTNDLRKYDTYEEGKAAGQRDLDIKLAGKGDAAGEEIREGAGIPAEALKDTSKDVTVDVVDADGNVITGTPEDVEKNLELAGKGDAAGKQVDQMEAYKNSITSKLEALVEKVNAKKSDNPTFFKFISEEKVNEFNALSAEDKNKVTSAIEGRGYLTEGQIMALWNTSLSGVVETNNAPTVIKLMPTEYHDTWAKCSEGKKNQIMAQSKYHKLETAYQVANFWQTRDLREVAPVMEKIAMVNESTDAPVQTLGYDATQLGAEIAKRFNR
jgi:hypothetical protein